MDNPLVSIIVPLYNSEQFVQQLVESVKKQKYSNWELIIIDDHSDDSTFKLASKFQNSRIHIFENNHKGVSSARNKGLELAKGTYIAFIDGDDIIDSYYIDSLVNDAIKSKADVVFQCYDEIVADTRKKMIFPWLGLSNQQTIYSKIVPTLVFPVGDEVCPWMPVWRTLIKRKIIVENHLFFDEKIAVGEDYQFLLKLLLSCNTMYGSDEDHYGYYRRAGSAMNSVRKNLIDEGLYTHAVFINTLKANNIYDSVKKRYISNRAAMYSHSISNIARDSDDTKTQILNLKKIRSYFLNDKIIDIPIRKLYNPLHIKIGLLLLKINCLWLVLFIYKTKEKKRIRALN